MCMYMYVHVCMNGGQENMTKGHVHLCNMCVYVLTLEFTGPNQLGPEEYKRRLINIRSYILKIDQAGQESGNT